MYRRNPMDSDNAKGACKVVFDAMVRLGWVKDDSERWMEQVVLPVVVDRKSPPRMFITVEKLTEKQDSIQEVGIENPKAGSPSEGS